MGPSPFQPSSVLVTGVGGFIGSHVADGLLSAGRRVVGVDCFTDFYPRAVKEANVAALRRAPRFELVEADLAAAPLDELLADVETVFHLAGQPGVRQSFGRGSEACVRHNVAATHRLLTAAVAGSVRAFVYASSSSVYGIQETYPTSEDAPLRPISPYGLTKVITEQLADGAWRRHGLPVVGLRYFTVYGPRQRPDMAVARFVSNAIAGRPVPILGDGRQVREFTYIDDVVAATMAAADRGEPGSVYNIGGGEPVRLLDVVSGVEDLLDRKLVVEHRPTAEGDPLRTEAETSRARRELGFHPTTPLSEGLACQLTATLDRARVRGAIA